MKKRISTLLGLGALSFIAVSLDNSTVPVHAEDQQGTEDEVLDTPKSSQVKIAREKPVIVVEGSTKRVKNKKGTLASTEEASLKKIPAEKTTTEKGAINLSKENVSVTDEGIRVETEQAATENVPQALATDKTLQIPAALANIANNLSKEEAIQLLVTLSSTNPAQPLTNADALLEAAGIKAPEKLSPVDEVFARLDLSKITSITPLAFSNEDPANLLPWKKTEYYHFAKNQELKELIRNFCSSQSVNVIVSDAVTDVVNGKFSNIMPRQFWKDVVSAYNLIWFYDGSMLYVYKSHEILSNVYQMSRDEMRTLVKVIMQLGFLSSNVNFRPLETAGILVVSGPPKLMSMIEELSKKVVVERVSNVYDIRSFPLKHAWAYDMEVNYRGGSMKIPGVASMLQQIVTTLPEPISGVNVGVSIDSAKSNEAIPLAGVAGTAVKRAQAAAKEEAKQSNTEGKEKPQLGISLGNIFITYDTRLNSVIVKAKRQDMKFIESIIEQLDVSRSAIRIDVAVVDISKGDARKLGAKLVTSFTRNGIERAKYDGNFLTLENAKDNKDSLTVNFDKLFKGFKFNQIIDTLEDVGNAQTLTRSSVITLDNIGAAIDSSKTQYVAVSGNESESLYDVTVSQKVVVVPHVVPGAFDENGAPKIKLLIEVTDGSFDMDPKVNPGSPSEPKTSTNTVNTEATIYEGQSLFIGGYFHEHHGSKSAGIPILKDIPLLGNLFSMKNSDNSVVERIYIITPTIITEDDPKLKTLNRFFEDSQLSGGATLKPNEFNLTQPYEKKPYDQERFEAPKKKMNWKNPFKGETREFDERKYRNVWNRQAKRGCRR